MAFETTQKHLPSTSVADRLANGFIRPNAEGRARIFMVIWKNLSERFSRMPDFMGSLGGKDDWQTQGEPTLHQPAHIQIYCF